MDLPMPRFFFLLVTLDIVRMAVTAEWREPHLLIGTNLTSFLRIWVRCTIRCVLWQLATPHDQVVP